MYLSLSVLGAAMLGSCAKVYYSPDSRKLASGHKLVAVMPPAVSIAASKKIDGEAMKEQQKTESLNFQKEIYSWMLKRKMQGRFVFEVLDVETTNAKLKKAGYPDNPLSPAEICELLEVNGIITSNFGLSKPMSEGGAIALNLLGGYGYTNQARASVSIHDCPNKKLIWNYEHKISGGIGSTPAKMVDILMRKASRKMPYSAN